MLPNRFFFALSLFTCLSLSAPAISAQPTILVTGDCAPYTGESLENYGFFTHIVTAVFEEMEETPQYRFLPWKRCETQIKEQQAWAAFPYSPNQKRRESFDFSDPVSLSTTAFFYNRTAMKPISWAHLEDLKPYLIGSVNGYFYEDRLKQANLKISVIPKEEQGLKMLHNNRINLLPINDMVGWKLIRQLFPGQVDRFATLEKPLSTDTLHLMIKKNDPESQQLLKRFNAALQRIREKGIYQDILSQM